MCAIPPGRHAARPPIPNRGITGRTTVWEVTVTTDHAETPQRHREQLDQLHEHVETLRTSDGWQRWLGFASRFRDYSLNNQLLILMQRPDATRVAGYKTWQSLGRQVNKGEHGIAIFAPRTRLVDDDDGERKRVVSGFHVVRVFDVSQTSGEPIPQITLPDVAGSSEAIFGALIAAAHAEELQVTQVHEHPDWDGRRGWFNHDERTITLIEFNQGLDNMTRTLLHELAHYCDPAAHHDPGHELKPILEVTAESAAMIVGTGVLGLEMSDASATYVATWMEALDGLDADFMAELAEHALRVARHLEAIVTPHLHAAGPADDEPVPIP
jgi:antirestriction protein ArdC